jgi:hypothetical protein
VNDWGYDFIKTDFSEWSLLAQQRFADASYGTAAAYRLGTRVIRDAMGPHRHLLDCGPAPTALGLVDSMRIELDRPIPENPLWSQYWGYYNSTIPAVAKRYFWNNRGWINDADHIRLVGLNIPQGQAAATITALSGGTMIAGDKLYNLDSERLTILKKVFPAWGHAARPLDLYSTDSAELFALPVKSATAGEWNLLGCFNGGETTRTVSLKLDALGLTGGRDYLVFDFWSQRLRAETSGVLQLQQGPTSCNLLGIRTRTGAPQVLGTDRHFTQGAIELSDVAWSDADATLSGNALGAPGMSWNLFVYVPQKYRLKAEQDALSEHATMQSPRVMQLPTTFRDCATVPWRLHFTRGE